MASTQITQPESIRIVFAKGTDVGRKRGHNEDYVDAFSPPDAAKRRQKGELFVVADGMGGHRAGEVASKNAVETISREYYADPDTDIAGALTRAMQKANASIYQQAQETISQSGMGTTAVAAVTRGHELYLANVGDSRAYLMRGGKIKQVTRDHSFVEEQIRAGILTREEARTHARRNVITRALGAKPNVEVDTYRGKLEPGDTVLLCTDGLSEYVQEQDLETVLKLYPPQESVTRLIGVANERGGNDNITALVLQATPIATTARPEDTAPVAPQPEDTGRQGLSVPLLAGLIGGGLIVVAALVAGAVFLTPIFGGGGATATPTTMAPDPTTSATMPPPTATLQSTERAVATSTLVAPSLELLEPADEATFTRGTRATFRWKVIGMPLDSFSFVARTNQAGYEELCRSEQEVCTITLDTEGDFEWWAELLHEGQRIARSNPRTFYVLTQATPGLTPTLSFTSPLPTTTPQPTQAEGG
jgi:serine/threonine protein phosphatase PrpC